MSAQEPGGRWEPLAGAFVTPPNRWNEAKRCWEAFIPDPAPDARDAEIAELRARLAKPTYAIKLVLDTGTKLDAWMANEVYSSCGPWYSESAVEGKVEDAEAPLKAEIATLKAQLATERDALAAAAHELSTIGISAMKAENARLKLQLADSNVQAINIASQFDESVDQAATISRIDRRAEMIYCALGLENTWKHCYEEALDGEPARADAVAKIKGGAQ